MLAEKSRMEVGFDSKRRHFKFNVRASNLGTACAAPSLMMRSSTARGGVEERRATSRYNLVLPVEIRVTPNLVAVGPILVETRDISTNGFYFNIAQQFTVGT